MQNSAIAYSIPLHQYQQACVAHCLLGFHRSPRLASLHSLRLTRGRSEGTLATDHRQAFANPVSHPGMIVHRFCSPSRVPESSETGSDVFLLVSLLSNNPPVRTTLGMAAGPGDREEVPVNCVIKCTRPPGHGPFTALSSVVGKYGTGHSRQLELG